MVLFGYTLIVVTLHSMMATVRGGETQQTGTRIMMFNIPNTEHNETRERLDDALNLLKSLEFYASADESSRNTLAESTDMHSVADSTSTRTECDKVNCKDIVHKEPKKDEKLNKVGCDGECVINSLDNTSSKALEATSSGDPVVITHLGRVRGLTLDKAHVFYGIPYADPPLGDKRWAPPSSVSPWTYTYDATFPRPACMQMCAGEFSRMCPPKVSEDCLYLNVFVPVSVNLSLPITTALPVMVWIHGGDFIAGSASKPLYDGRFISNYSNTVVVNMEYRLGAFGFLVTGKDPESSAVGNYGILDQQAALRWVQENIADFGGDPNKVTLFSESAGAQSVCLHLMMRSSESLFRHAAIQSLPFSLPLKTRWDAVKLGWDFAKLTNCSAFDLPCLRSLSSHDVLNAQVESGSKIINPFRFLEVFETWGPFIDGELIREQPITAFQTGHWQSYKPVILGTTSEEGVTFVYNIFNRSVSTLECVLYTAAIFKQHALKILHKYIPFYRDQDRRVMLSQIVTDYMFLCPTRFSARSGVKAGGAVWLYVFDHAPSDHNIWEGLPFCYNHTCHGAELPFLFDSAPSTNFTLTPEETLLANRMACYWGTFAHTGNPNSRSEQTHFCSQQRLPVWPRYTASEGWPILNLTLPSHPQHGDRDHFCDFWDRLDIY
ncbi:cAMP-regulated D2 protein [Puntigrus tetrazona]|uniref:cAMP-regulated D2 protein n=1 Tax=Puntigrus tetrazona TaxID=1606681 RepID=UPI001C89A5F0|nr:cAMP-regulated D2 protein [Puntigrus tetrazona]XP_043072515.1 cAMP-regulated D2 protein [Puntigrus tetrazona]XP_043072517.1 cAMP-regulated D2 protein [Puntigrus tetrazona]